jgi:hypothetical protein
MTNNVLLTPGKAAASFSKLSPPTQAQAPLPRSEEPIESFHRSSSHSGLFSKIALLGIVGLSAVTGATMHCRTAPEEVAYEAGSEASATREVPAESLKENPSQGLAAIPSDWIPSGESSAYAESPFGVARGTTTRGTKQIKLDLRGRINPDLTITDLGDGRVEALVDLPGPFDQTSVGQLRRDGDKLVYQSESGGTSATVKKNDDGSLSATLHRDGWSDWNLLYRGR